MTKNNKKWYAYERQSHYSLDKPSINQLNNLILSHSKSGGSTLLSNHMEIKIPRSKKIFLKKPASNLNKKIINFNSWDDVR